MIKKLLFSIIFLLSGILGFCQFIFQISPGPKFNGVNIGYKLDKGYLFYGGLQFVNVNYSLDETGERIVDGKLTLYHDASNFSKDLYIPNLGFKFYFGEGNKLKPYTNINIAKPLVKGFPKNVINKINWTGELGFGSEYFFDENFSIGGEFGIRNLDVNVTKEYREEIFDPVSGNTLSTTKTTQLKTDFSPTYTRISLNFYF